MKKHIISYATADYYNNQRRLNKSALKFGIKEINSFNERQLKTTLFYKQNKLILDQKRGAGYWLWKPYIILSLINKIDYGDLLIYSDVGVEIIKDISPLINLCTTQNGILLFRTHGHLNRTWTKRDCFIEMSCDSNEYYDSEQLMAGFQVYIKNNRSVSFLEEYLHYCQKGNIITDSENTLGFNNLPEFVEHRHDQSVLSILAIKHQIEIFRDPSQWGNHMKMAEFREPDEWLSLPYSDSPYTNSPYSTLLNHHRERPIRFVDHLKNSLDKLKQKVVSV